MKSSDFYKLSQTYFAKISSKFFDILISDITVDDTHDGYIPELWIVLDKILEVAFFVETPIGLAANIFAIVIAGKLANTNKLSISSSIHLQAICFWSFWSLFIDGFVDNIVANILFDLGSYNNITCGLSTYLDWATSRAAILAVAISACDRCFAGK